MIRKLTLIVGCIALFILFAGAAMADSITFTFAITTTPVNVTVVGGTGGTMTMAPVGDVVVKDDAGISFVIPDGIVTISSANDGWYNDVGGQMNALYNGSPGVEVSVTSLAICGGPCLLGDMNQGMYIGQNNNSGAWGAIYDLTYVSPAILALFDEQGWYLEPYGSDVFTTTHNLVGLHVTNAQLGSGSITFEAYTPEPGTLVLVGTGILGLARRLWRR